jgi:hypothetical protein
MDNEEWQMVKNFLCLMLLGSLFMAFIFIIWALFTLDSDVQRHIDYLAKIHSF